MVNKQTRYGAQGKSTFGCGACASDRRASTPCNNNNMQNNSSCQDLLYRLQTLDFSIYDTVLYLDAYPNCAEALDYYQKLVSERQSLLNKLATNCHTPITCFDNAADHWDWTVGPWPWQLEANEKGRS